MIVSGGTKNGRCVLILGVTRSQLQQLLDNVDNNWVLGVQVGDMLREMRLEPEFVEIVTGETDEVIIELLKKSDPGAKYRDEIEESPNTPENYLHHSTGSAEIECEYDETENAVNFTLKGHGAREANYVLSTGAAAGHLIIECPDGKFVMRGGRITHLDDAGRPGTIN